MLYLTIFFKKKSGSASIWWIAGFQLRMPIIVPVLSYLYLISPTYYIKPTHHNVEILYFLRVRKKWKMESINDLHYIVYHIPLSIKIIKIHPDILCNKLNPESSFTNSEEVEKKKYFELFTEFRKAILFYVSKKYYLPHAHV